MEDPKLAKGIVKRDVVEVVTPGITFSDKLLDHKSNNYIASAFVREDKCGFAFCDVTTGEFLTSEIPFRQIKEQLELINPAETIISKSQKANFSDVLQLETSGLVRNFLPGSLKPNRSKGLELKITRLV